MIFAPGRQKVWGASRNFAPALKMHLYIELRSAIRVPVLICSRTGFVDGVSRPGGPGTPDKRLHFSASFSSRPVISTIIRAYRTMCGTPAIPSLPLWKADPDHRQEDGYPKERITYEFRVAVPAGFRAVNQLGKMTSVNLGAFQKPWPGAAGQDLGAGKTASKQSTAFGLPEEGLFF